MIVGTGLVKPAKEVSSGTPDNSVRRKRFLLAIFGKGDKDNLSKAERNALAAILLRIAQEYRKGKRK